MIRRASRSLSACALLLALASMSPRAVSSDIVISEFRFRGPNGGSDEFIELFNRGAAPVPIGGWIIRGSNASGTTSVRATIPAGIAVPAGCFFLLTNASNSGGPYSGAAPGDHAYTVGITDDGGIAILTPGGTIVDQVGLSAGSAYKEGTPAASLGSSNQNRSYERNPGGAAGHDDHDDNLSDFRLITPSGPQNRFSPCLSSDQPTLPAGEGTATPSALQRGDSVLLEVAVTAGANPVSTGLSVTVDLTPIAGGGTLPLLDDGSSGDAAAGDGVFSATTLVPATSSSGQKTLTATITDAQARSNTASISLVVFDQPIAIHEIQGAGSTSPLEGQLVTTTGIVTARRDNGFFLQTPDAESDGDPGTSDGLFVFAGSVPEGVAIRQRIVVFGRVQEFRPGGVGPSITEISGSPLVGVLSGGHPLPSPAELAAADTLPPDAAVAQLERFEGMRVTGNFEVVAPTGAFGQSAAQERNADPANSRNEFYMVVQGVPRPFREPGLEPGQMLPSGAPCCVPRFDGNPERIRVDVDGQDPTLRMDVASRQVLNGLTGVLDFGFGNWTLLPDPGSAAPPIPPVAPVPVPGDAEFTIASFNMQRLFDTINHDADAGTPGDQTDDVVMTPAGFERRLRKASLAIRQTLRMPDILGVVEAENLDVLQGIAARVNADAGDSNPGYVAYLAEGNDPGGIDVGFLVKSATVDVVAVTQVGKVTTYVTPAGDEDLLNDRPPLVLEARVHGPVGEPYPVTAIVNHLRSLNGIDDAEDGARVRTKRRAQAEFLASYVQQRQQSNPAERIALVGDFNAFEFSDGYVDSIGTIAGRPSPADRVVLASADLVDPDLANLLELADPGERYSFVFAGNPQALDHVLVTAPLRRRFTRLAFGRGNADMPEALRQFDDRPERLSDHDAPVAYFAFPGAPIVALAGEQTMTVEAFTGTYVEPGASASDEDGALAVTIEGAVDVNVPGTYVVTYTATNGYLTGSNARTVRVVDRTAPRIAGFSFSPDTLWAPNHRLVDVYVAYSAEDASGAASCTLAAASDQPDDGIGDGDTEMDVVPVDAHRIRLRAERAGRAGPRAYTVSVACIDAAANVSRASGVVRVSR